MNETKHSLHGPRWRAITDDSEKSEERFVKEDSKASWKDIATTAAGVTSLAGIALYGSVHFADAAFYARLGLTPEDVGLDPAVTLGRVAVSFMLIGVALFIATLPAVVFFQRTSFPWLLIALVGATLGNLLLVVLFAPSSGAGRLLLAAAEFLFILAALTVREIGLSVLLDKVKEKKMEAVMFASFIVICMFVAAGSVGFRAAYDIESRATSKLSPGLNPESFPGAGRLGLLGVEAKPANIVWVSDSLKGAVKTTKGFPLIFLGTERNLHFLYDARRKLVMRVPAGLVLIDIRS
ncbi:hypothetical protein [Streptomyces triticiradicis]|uniref:Uncharacterized protein n=1 Tax=Streptomyces triticiradicis TaxID=2651189 RepID=A0A7J5D2W1_9ACTN|nr:hypothetical protein [Streptomyces triticiradicis]KAB1977848.1 hypothetical protein F8144_40855 [Streptomyces triticiradicis]